MLWKVCLIITHNCTSHEVFPRLIHSFIYSFSHSLNIYWVPTTCQVLGSVYSGERCCSHAAALCLQCFSPSCFTCSLSLHPFFQDLTKYYSSPFLTCVPTSIPIYQPAHITTHITPHPKYFTAVPWAICQGFLWHNTNGGYMLSSNPKLEAGLPLRT